MTALAVKRSSSALILCKPHQGLSPRNRILTFFVIIIAIGATIRARLTARTFVTVSKDNK